MEPSWTSEAQESVPSPRRVVFPVSLYWSGDAKLNVKWIDDEAAVIGLDWCRTARTSGCEADLERSYTSGARRRGGVASGWMLKVVRSLPVPGSGSWSPFGVWKDAKQTKVKEREKKKTMSSFENFWQNICS